MSRQRSRQMSRQRSIQDERVLPVESWGDLQKYLITNHRTRQEGLKKYEKEFLARYKKRQKIRPKKKVSIPLRQIEDLGRLSFREHVIVKREEYLAERDEYEQKYLHRRVKTRNGKTKTSIPLRQIEDLGRLSFREHIIVNREEYLAERNDYEQMYLHRCTKKQNGKPKRSSSKKFDHDLISGRLNLREQVEEKRKELQTDRKEYEKKYLSRYKKSETKLKKSKPSKEYNEDLGRLDFQELVVTRREKLQAERLEYEMEFLARYNKRQKTRPKGKRSKQLVLELKPKRNIKQERKEYEKKYVSKFKKLHKTKLKIAALEQKLRLSQIELEEPKPNIKQKRREYEKEYIARYSKQQKAKPKKKVFAIR